MKKLMIALILILSAMVSGIDANAQTVYKKNKHNYIVLTSNIEQLKPILISAEKLQAEDGKKFGDFQVVVCGKTVEN
ncbi:MAG: hypothetical protein ACXWW0_00795 [Bacteroidia bacterium]